jgi:glutathione synthase/RimK-type ligase-like ATP-grasp enzyme
VAAFPAAGPVSLFRSGDQMKIVIVALDNDNHTAPIKWALEEAGYRVACWGGLSWEEGRQVSISFDENTQLELGPFSVDPGDVVWIRRPNPPLHHPNVAAPDKNFAQGEYKWFSWSALYLLEKLPVRCINRYSASRLINNKSVQLLLAKRSGLHVPETLMSNSPVRVRAFLERGPTQTICKAFFPHIWKKANSEALAVTETFEISADRLPADEVLTYAPAIYQTRIVKDFDVRMVLLGTTVYSYALHNPKGAIDWRQDAGQGIVTVEPIATPSEVEKAVLVFADQAGITFGSFDFAVDRSDKWWFLEVNEEGQFLWLDDLNPAGRILEKFLAFLTLPESSSRQTIQEREAHFPSWKDYSRSPAREQVPPEVNVGAPILSIEQ